jgi:NTP pyrophosphatase (non-canonical NTP hydrolase)
VADATTTIETLKDAVRRFAAERRWEPFHSPKNVAMALAVEAAELMEPYRWLECDESRRLTDVADQRQAIADELADVTILLLNMSLSTGIDLSQSVVDKLAKNALKYPVDAESGQQGSERFDRGKGL